MRESKRPTDFEFGLIFGSFTLQVSCFNFLPQLSLSTKGDNVTS